jgi:hypothetical protein
MYFSVSLMVILLPEDCCYYLAEVGIAIEMRMAGFLVGEAEKSLFQNSISPSRYSKDILGVILINFLGRLDCYARCLVTTEVIHSEFSMAKYCIST